MSPFSSIFEKSKGSYLRPRRDRFIYVVVSVLVILIHCVKKSDGGDVPSESTILESLSVTNVCESPKVKDFYGSNGIGTPPVDRPEQISSTFGPRWQAAVSRDDFHRGIDFYDELNAPIYAVQNGTVFQLHNEVDGTMPGGGNVRIGYSIKACDVRFIDTRH